MSKIPSQPAENVLDEVLAGTRLAYNFTSFDYGEGSIEARGDVIIVVGITIGNNNRIMLIPKIIFFLIFPQR